MPNVVSPQETIIVAVTEQPPFPVTVGVNAINGVI